MAELETLFATQVYRAALGGDGAARLNRDLRTACLSIARDDRAGQAWCREHNYAGYTSYSSLSDLTVRAPQFADLDRRLMKHVRAFARALHFDLGQRKLALDSIWINVLKPGGVHTSHIHPHSVISGTYYVTVPKGASALKLEDPRLGFMMAAPPKKPSAPREAQPFIYLTPKPGHLILFESWLRHEVPANAARENRISVSFNYAWV
ncbi:MAG: hypothetical protein KBA31_12145 [Alphaproteobacteria bacterium]|nr:hypothetical protein [Alphaproteobacteria bacterium]